MAHFVNASKPHIFRIQGAVNNLQHTEKLLPVLLHCSILRLDGLDTTHRDIPTPRSLLPVAELREPWALEPRE